MLFIIILSGIIETVFALGAEVTVECGQLVIQGYNSCEIQHAEDAVQYTGPKRQNLSGLRFGLISYKCDHEAGYLISEFDCKGCNFECAEENSSSYYQDEATQYWSGVISGICFAAVVSGVAIKCMYHKFKISYNKRVVKSSIYFNKNSDISAKKEAEHDNDQKGVQHAVEEILDRDVDTQRIKPVPLKSKHLLLSVIISILLFKNVICENYVVVEKFDVSKAYSFSGSSAQTPIFTLDVGEHIQVHGNSVVEDTIYLSEIYSRSRYELVYYTSDYITSEPTIASECCDPSEVCSLIPGPCYDRALAQLTPELKIEIENSRIYDNCFESSQTSLEMRCTWFQEKKRKGEIYGVYKKTGTIGTVKMTIKNDSRIIKLSSYDSTYELPSLIKDIDTIPINVIEVKVESPDFLLLYGDEFYYVNGSTVDKPQKGMFGDLQISLNKTGEKFATHVDDPHGFCAESNDYLEPCTCNCSVPNTESMISQFAMKKSGFKQPNRYIVRKSDLSEIDAFETFKTGSARIQLGNRSKDYDERSGAKCEVEFVASYGCISCNESAYIIMKARNIVKEGLVYFNSNCSFDRQSVKCDYEPTKIILKENYRTCSIDGFSGTKESFLINMKYHDFSHLFKTKLNYTENTPGEALKYLVTSKQFIEAFILTAVLCFLFTVIVAITFRIFLLRRDRNCMRMDEFSEENLVDL